MLRSRFIVLATLFLVLFNINLASTPASGKGGWAKLGMPPLEIEDAGGKILDYGTIGQIVVVKAEVVAMNPEYVGVPFSVLAEVRDMNGITVFLQAIEQVVNATYTDPTSDARANVSVFWLPDDRGRHSISLSVISNLTSPELLGPPRTVELSILGECNPPGCRVIGDDEEYRQNYRSIGTVREGPARQKAFIGPFTYEADNKCRAETLLRCTPYKLDGMSVYTGADNLDDYVGHYRIRDRPLPSFEWVNLDDFLGHRVEIVGKILKYDGIEEIVPVRIRMVE